MKIVVIDWVDSVRAFDWTLIEDVEEKSLDCVSVGFLLNETDKQITIAQNYGIKPEQVCNLITIPKCCIKNIREIKEEYTWKPSEGEISILKDVVSGMCNPQNYQATLLNILEQLKKLREL